MKQMHSTYKEITYTLFMSEIPRDTVLTNIHVFKMSPLPMEITYLYAWNLGNYDNIFIFNENAS